MSTVTRANLSFYFYDIRDGAVDGKCVSSPCRSMFLRFLSIGGLTGWFGYHSDVLHFLPSIGDLPSINSAYSSESS